MNLQRAIGMATALLAIGLAGGCGFILRHTSNITSAPDVEVVKIPPPLDLHPQTTSHPESKQWVLVSSSSVGPIPAGGETLNFDLSTILSRDPYAGPWIAPLPTEQRVFVPAADVDTVMADPQDWSERYVIQLAVNDGPEIKIGTHEAGRLSIEDAAHVLCHAGVTRRTLSADPAQIIYESKFSNCPRFGPDRIVLTRELFGNWDSVRHSQAIYSFSYEVRGDKITEAQRTTGMRLIQGPHLLMASQEGEKHPIFRDEKLRMVAEP